VNKKSFFSFVKKKKGGFDGADRRNSSDKDTKGIGVFHGFPIISGIKT
jgi:hypothetical protein